MSEDMDEVETPAYEIAAGFAHGDEALAAAVRHAMRTAIAAEREACARKLDDLSIGARTAGDNYRALGNSGMDALRHDARASAYAAGANAIRARGTT